MSVEPRPASLLSVGPGCHGGLTENTGPGVDGTKSVHSARTIRYDTMDYINVRPKADE